MSSNNIDCRVVGLEVGGQMAAARDGAPEECPTCKARLDVHQPDFRDPDRLLAVCTGCSTWFLVEFQESLQLQFMVKLPHRVSLQASEPWMGGAELAGGTDDCAAIGA